MTSALDSPSARPDCASVLPGEDGWDDARRPWNLAADQHPALVAHPETAEDVIAAVDFARRRGLRVAAQTTGHAATELDPLDDALPLRTGHLREVQIDPETRRARVGGGVQWGAVAAAAAAHGLAGPAGLLGHGRRGGLHPGRRHRPARAPPRAGVQRRARGRARDRRREAAARRRRPRAGAVLGAARRRRRELRRGHRARVRPPPGGAGRRWASFCGRSSGPPRCCTPGGRPPAGCRRRSPPSAGCSTCRRSRSCPRSCAAASCAVVEVADIRGPGELDGLLAPLRALGPEMDTVGARAGAGAREAAHGPRGPRARHLRRRPARRGHRRRRSTPSSALTAPGVRVAAAVGRAAPAGRRARLARPAGAGVVSHPDAEGLVCRRRHRRPDPRPSRR